MSIEPYLLSIYLSYFLAVWFFASSVLAIWSRSKSQKVLSSVTLFLVWAFYSYILVNREVLMDPLPLAHVLEVVAWFDFITALVLTMWLKRSKGTGFIRTLPEWLRYDDIAWKYVIIIFAAAMCHFVMLYDVVIDVGYE